tara:strand:- start:15263 stop:16231 length:969 start_codon:yes stop_codon:yes gene_type:complete
MPQFYTLPTAIGQAKMANALALGQTVNITHMAVGDGGGTLPTPNSNRTALVNEIRRAPINASEVDEQNPTWVVVEQVLPPDVGGWTIREVGIIDQDGDLIAYGNYPETYKPILSEGSGRTQTIRFVLEVSDTAAVTLKIDPAVVLATRAYVDGRTQIATQAVVNEGENDTQLITPKKLKAWATQWVKQATETVAGMLKVATQAQVDAGEDDTTAVTPKKLRWGFSYSFGQVGYIFLPSWMGGFVMQWGKYTSSSGGKIPGNFPVAFPNQYFGSVGTFFGGFSGIDTANVKVEANTLTSFNFATVNQNGAFSNSPLFLIHLGY